MDTELLYRNEIVIRAVSGLALSCCKVPSLFCIIEGNVVAELRNNNAERQITNDVYQVGFSSMWYSCPHHYASATESVYFLDTVSSKPFISTFFKFLFFHLHVTTGTCINRWTRLFSSAIVAILDASEPIGVCFDDGVGSNWHHKQDV